MYNNVHLFIDFSWQYFADDVNNCLARIFQMAKLAYQHQAQVYYNQEQLANFRLQLADLNIEFSESIGNKLDVILRNAKRSTAVTHLFKVNNLAEQTNLIYSCQIYLSPSLSQIEFFGMLSLNDAMKGNTKYLHISETDFNTVEFVGCNTQNDLLNCIWEKGEPRNFHYSEKHGENGVGNQPGESVLLCSRAEATNLLQNAIPDFSEKKRRLFNFDDFNNCFIEFFYEGDNPQKQWHGFHVLEPLWISRIPNSILRHYNKT